MEPSDLARWTRFAMKGGIGRCIAICDCVAESSEDLMFLKDDEIVVLLQVVDADGIFLGYCEGVIGRFLGRHVRFLTKLKKPVMAKRSSNTPPVKSPTPTFGSASMRSDSRASSRYKSPQASPTSAQHSPMGSAGRRIHSVSSSPAFPSAIILSPPDPEFANWGTTLDLVQQHQSDQHSPKSRPVSLDLSLDSMISPLRISKKSPILPPSLPESAVFPNEQESVSTEIPDTSYSTTFGQRLSRASSDGEVGIGLSLLQDLVDGMGDSSDDDDDEDWSRSSGEGESKRENIHSDRAGAVRVSDEETVDGLVYGDDNDDEDPNATPPKPPVQSPTIAQSLDFPMPPSSPRSPTSPSSAILRNAHERQRRPSLAASLAPSATSSSSWEGASDIYDNYRYSRFSMSSAKAPSHRSSQGTNAGAPPLPAIDTSVEELRGRVDSDASVYTQASTGGGNTINVRMISSSPPAQAGVARTLVVGANRPSPVDEASPLLDATWGSSSPTTLASGLIFGGGVASAMRQIIEERKGEATPTSPVFGYQGEEKGEDVMDDSIVSGLGNRIVVEEEEGDGRERILDGEEMRESPELVTGQGRLEVLVVSNRTSEDEEEEGTTFEGEEDHDDDEEATINFLPSTPISAGAPPLTPSESDLVPPTSPPAAPSHLHPSLRDLREGGTVHVPGTGERRSLFLPHPNAPKAPLMSPGPMYVQQQQKPLNSVNHPIYGPPPPLHLQQRQQYSQLQQQQQYQPNYYQQRVSSHPPPRLTFAHVIRQALNTPPLAPRPVIAGRVPLAPRGPTIYGRLEMDLASAMGPVGVVWSLEPPPTKVLQKVVAGARPSLGGLRESAVGEEGEEKGDGVGEGGGGEGEGEGEGEGKVGEPIPRANFFPKVRPRSRSFSDLKSVQGPIQSSSNLRSSVSGGEIKKSSSLSYSHSASTSSPGTMITTVNVLNTAKPVKSSPLRPSPLSLSQNIMTNRGGVKEKMSMPVMRGQTTTTGASNPGRAMSVPSSPSVVSFGAGGSTSTSGSTSGSGIASSALSGLRKLASRSTTMDDGSASRPLSLSSSNEGGAGRPILVSRSTMSLVTTNERGVEGEEGSVRMSAVATPPPLTMATNNGGSPSMGSPPSHIPLVRQPSLKTKLSLPNLRRNRSRQEEDPPSPVSPVTERMHQDMMFQVQDMEFELVRPNFGQYSAAARTSEDSAILGRDVVGGGVGEGGVGSGSGYLRPESPAVSISSGRRSPTIDGNHTTTNWVSTHFRALSPASMKAVVVESEAQMEAHRNRELKWMSMLSTWAPAQARKSKKVRKLLLEGVPSSVRYMVWSHLTNGKARCVPGVYGQLCKRGRVPFTEDIEADVGKGWFVEEEQGQLRAVGGELEGGRGGVVQLLQAYLNMVPDIQYMPGLPHIVGQLLLLAPEEDAFWIFVSIMDTHIRPYFSVGSTQMEVDSALFCRALEVNDGGVAKKLLVDMGISPNLICAPWFSSLYVGCLPAEYLTRTWDLFLYDGVSFLIRVGLGIVSFVRRQLLECTSEEVALGLLHRPPVVHLPPTAESYLSFVFSIKFKDEDVRKQRIKMEAQVKRQTQQQQPRSSNTAGSISLPRA